MRVTHVHTQLSDSDSPPSVYSLQLAKPEPSRSSSPRWTGNPGKWFGHTKFGSSPCNVIESQHTYGIWHPPIGIQRATQPGFDLRPAPVLLAASPPPITLFTSKTVCPYFALICVTASSEPSSESRWKRDCLTTWSCRWKLEAADEKSMKDGGNDRQSRSCRCGVCCGGGGGRGRGRMSSQGVKTFVWWRFSRLEWFVF